MMPATERTNAKDERLEARVSPEMKALLQEAAAIDGRSLTDFLVSSAAEVARRTLREREFIELTRRDRQAFVNALLSAPEPSARLRKAARRHEQVFGKR